jgi:hypothetical protein
MFRDPCQGLEGGYAADSQQENVRRQAPNIFRIKLLGARVVPVESGSRTLRDAVNEVGSYCCYSSN